MVEHRLIRLVDDSNLRRYRPHLESLLAKCPPTTIADSEFGKRLYNYVRMAFDATHSLNTQTVCLHIAGSKQSESCLPWEWLNDGTRFLCRKPHFEIAYCTTVQERRLKSTLPAETCVVSLSVGGGTSRNGLQLEGRALYRRLGNQADRVQFIEIRTTTTEEARKRLQENQPTILHLFGRIKQHNGNVALILSELENESDYLSMGDIVAASLPPVVVLHVERTVDSRTLLWDAARVMTQAGVEEVITFESATDSTGRHLFTDSFYNALMAGVSVDKAFAHARMTLLGISSVDDPEWHALRRFQRDWRRPAPIPVQRSAKRVARIRLRKLLGTELEILSPRGHAVSAAQPVDLQWQWGDELAAAANRAVRASERTLDVWQTAVLLRGEQVVWESGKKTIPVSAETPADGDTIQTIQLPVGAVEPGSYLWRVMVRYPVDSGRRVRYHSAEITSTLRLLSEVEEARYESKVARIGVGDGAVVSMLRATLAEEVALFDEAAALLQHALAVESDPTLHAVIRWQLHGLYARQAHGILEADAEPLIAEPDSKFGRMANELLAQLENA